VKIDLTFGKFTVRITFNAFQVCKIEVFYHSRACCIRVRDNVWKTEAASVTIDLSDAPNHIDAEFKSLMLAYCGGHGYVEGHFDDGIEYLGVQAGCRS